MALLKLPLALPLLTLLLAASEARAVNCQLGGNSRRFHNFDLTLTPSNDAERAAKFKGRNGPFRLNCEFEETTGTFACSEGVLWGAVIPKGCQAGLKDESHTAVWLSCPALNLSNVLCK